MQAIEEVGRYDVGRDSSEECGVVVGEWVDDAVVEVVVPHSFDGSFIKDQTRKARVVQEHIGSWCNDDSVKTAVYQGKVKVDVYGTVRSVGVHVVHERQQHVLVGSVERYSGRSSEVNVKLGVDVGSFATDALS